MPLLLLKRLKKLLQENNKLTFTFTILYKADCNNLPLFLSILKTISIMKKVIILLLLVTAMTTAFGQSAKFGIKGGLNFGATGDITTIDNQNFDGDSKLGYHVGILTQFKFSGIFLQPELLYTSLTTEYGSVSGADADYTFSKIDVPVLLGFDIVGPLNIKAGPAFQYVLNNELDINEFTTEDPENSFTIGYQVGAGIQLGKLGIDLRYEGAFAENDISITSDLTDIANEQFTVDSRPTQWILSVSYMFGDK